MSIDAANDLVVTLDESATDAHRCLWIKITQLLGEVQCYLQPGHDGAHCSAEWMEWT